MNLIASTLLALLIVTACHGQKSERGATRRGSGGRSETGQSSRMSLNPASQLKVFRGDIGNNQVEMRLRRAGENLSGTYAYDGTGQSLKLKGRIDSGGKLTLQEFDAKGRQTGKFDCQYVDQSLESPTPTIQGQWSKPGGNYQIFVSLTEQPAGFTNGSRITPKMMTEKRLGIRAVYPQISAVNNPAIAGFNRQVTALVRKALSEFKSTLDADSGKSHYVMNYNVLLATDELVSVELNAESSAGDMYSNEDHHTITYDLRAGRALALDALFKSGSDYKNALYDYTIKNVKERMRKLREEDGSKRREEDDEPSFMGDSWSSWAMSSKGVFLYYELPHVAEYFERVFIPYAALKDLVNPGGPAAVFSNEKAAGAGR